MSGVYKVTVAIGHGRLATVLAEGVDRMQAKARALNQVHAMGHVADEDDVMLCRKASNADVKAIGNRPTPPNGGRTA